MDGSTSAWQDRAGGAARPLKAAVGWLYPHPGFWLALGMLAIFNMAWMFLDSRLSLAPQSLVKIAFVVFGTGLALAYRQWRGAGHGRVFDALFRLLMLALFAGFLTQQVNLFSHLVMTLGFPWADQHLAAWDRGMGFDWNAYVRQVCAARWSGNALLAAYSQLIGPALGAILLVAVWRDRHDRVDELAFLALAAGFICVAVAGLLPAEGAWATLATREAARVSGGPFLQDMVAQIHALRGDAPVSLDFAAMEGLANFPSYHTCLAIIVMWCSRGRWFTALPAGVAGLAILAATPVYGGHYLVDLLGGAAVMAGLVLLWARLAPRVRPGGGRP